MQLKAISGRLPTKPATLILQTVHERAATAVAPTPTDAFHQRATAPAPPNHNCRTSLCRTIPSRIPLVY